MRKRMTQILKFLFKSIDRFRFWIVERQSAKFAKELKEKNYQVRKPWNNGVWK